MMINGKVMKGDMSFKLAKKVTCDRGRQFEAVYTLMNEFGQVLGFQFVRNTSFEQISGWLRQIKQRYLRQQTQQHDAHEPTCQLHQQLPFNRRKSCL